MGKKFIIDVDTGNDDALAIMLALHNPDVDVLAITCVNGNTSIDNVCKNTLRVLDVCSKPDIPVYKGAEKTIVPQIRHNHYYGLDGMGDFNWSDPVDTGRIQSEHAVFALLRMVNQYPGEITLVILGPMTNIALAIRLDPAFGDKLKEVFVMGGNLGGRGNVTRCAEFNFAIDPESVDVCLRDLNQLIHLIPWDPYLQHTFFPWEIFDKFTQLGTEKSSFVKKIYSKLVPRTRTNDRGFRAWDLFAMATALDSKVVMETEDVYAEMELQGHLTRGHIVIDHAGEMNMPPNLRVVKKFDKQQLIALTLNMLST